MDLKLRPGEPEDAEICAQICYEAFAAIAGKHSFAPDIPNLEAAVRKYSAPSVEWWAGVMGAGALYRSAMGVSIIV